ncbi:MAG: miniconductance mechanosensitive channel MscM [Candidatus Malihini olakiniferum]
MRQIAIFIFTTLFSVTKLAALVPNETQVRQQLEWVETNKNISKQADITEQFRLTLNTLKELKESLAHTQQYWHIIDNFSKLTQDLHYLLTAEENKTPNVSDKLSVVELEQKEVQITGQLLDQSRQLQKERKQLREIIDSLAQLPQKQTEVSLVLNETDHQIQLLGNPVIPTLQAHLVLLQNQHSLFKSRVDELEVAKLSARNRQELSRLRIELYQLRYNHLNQLLQILRIRIKILLQREVEKALEQMEQFAKQGENLPAIMNEQSQLNHELSQELNQQAQNLDLVASQQRQATIQTKKIRQALTTLREQSQWIGASTVLGEALRAQVARLPDIPQQKRLDTDIAKLRVQRLRYETLLSVARTEEHRKQENYILISDNQQCVLSNQLCIRRDLLTSLISGTDAQILEMTKLKVATSQLEEALLETREAVHRYLFWIADVNPISLSFPVQVIQALYHLLSLDTFTQLSSAFIMVVTNRETAIPLIGALILTGFGISSRRHYHAFLERASGCIGKVNLDHFSLTLRTLFYSILIALPFPMLWAALGYGLQNAWPYPIAVAIGDSVAATLPLVWLLMVSASFAHQSGLFIAHLHWSIERVARAMRYYRFSIAFIIPLIMAIITLENLNKHEFSSTLGRLCFILLCLVLSILTNSLKRIGIPLYLNKDGSRENTINLALWNLLISALLIAALASGIGYLATSKALLARLETSVAIWFFLVVVYHVIRRWMLIQRRRIAFDRAKQRRAEILAQRARSEEEFNAVTETTSDTIEEPVVDLDTISAKSLQMVRSILTLIALISIIALWSDIHSAFSFLENINLWEVTSIMKGVEKIQPITLGAVLISILIFSITTQVVRNLPALLELALLQHLNLPPGSGYAIITISKYMLMLIGCLIGFSFIGIEWSQLQWLVAALSVGLGFGLQEIFANFISGLIILFEKPIRIGDTVTIRDLTGNIMRINTRATTITDWDRKEIIVPNKAFITEQFINWSLSDSVTRVVLTVPAPVDSDSHKVTKILLDAVKRCVLVLENPPPEAFLVDLRQGIQIFELRIFTAEMGHRMPLRHEIHQLILEAYRKNNMEMPFPPFQVQMSSVRIDGCSLNLYNRAEGDL